MFSSNNQSLNVIDEQENFLDGKSQLVTFSKDN